MKNKKLAFLDIETTGFDVEKQEIIEIGVVIMNQKDGVLGEVVEEFELKIQPTKIENALKETLLLANITTNQIDKVFLTGGSTLVPSVKNIYMKYFPKNKIVHTDVFASVGYGLTLFSNKVNF